METIYLLNGVKYRLLKSGEVIKEGDLYKSTTGKIEPMPVWGHKLHPDSNVEIYREKKNER